MEVTDILTISIFLATIGLIAFEVFDKSIITSSAALILVLTGILSYEDAISAIDFDTILLLAGMMILVDTAHKSGFFNWLSVKITSLSKGNPFYIFLFFCLFTGFFSMFFPNVTTVLIITPIVLELVKGMGRDPKPYLLGVIFLANIGGAATLIGDPTNIIIGTAAGLTFNDFLINLFPAVTITMLATIVTFYLIKWPSLKPISKDFEKSFISNVLVRKIQYKFLSESLSKSLIIKSVIILLLTIVGYMLQSKLQIALPVIALTGAFLLILISSKHVKIEKTLEGLQWTTLLFFAGLFIIVQAIENTGILKTIAQTIATSTENFALLLIMIMWGAAIISMLVDNIAFVTVMVPIIFNIRDQLAGNPHLDLLWWALVFGAVFGGNGTIIGTSANIVGTDIAKKYGSVITFTSFLKYGLPFSALALSIASIYLLIRVFYF